MRSRIELPRKAVALFALFAAFILVGVASGGGAIKAQHLPATREATTAAASRVAVLFPGLIDDGAFNQLGYKGLQEAKAQGVKVAYQENVAQDAQEDAFRSFARRGYTTVIGYGGQFMDAALAAAKSFPKAQFVVINGNKSASNVTSIGADYYSLGYLAGVLGASSTKTKKLGLVVALQLPIEQQMEKGFGTGAAKVDPSVQTKTVVTGDFNDVEKARDATLGLIGQGVDVLWPFLNAGELGFFSAVEDNKDKGVRAMGFVVDESALAPGAVIGSMLDDLGYIVFRAATQRSILNHKVSYWGVAKGIVSVQLAPNTPTVVRSRIRQAARFLASHGH